MAGQGAAPDETLPMSQASRQSDEKKFLPGMSQSQRGDELIKIVQYSHETLFGTCTMLCNVVQLLQVNKLQTKPAMLRF